MARILLVDDDELMRDTVQQMLEIDGHDVVSAPDGDLGLEQFGKGGTFDLVITDILMPRMDGASMISALRRISPRMPVLAISGGRRTITSTFSLETAAIMGATRQLAKPFTRAQLQESVKLLLQPQAA